MDFIEVTQYAKEDHEEVCRIFEDGINENVKNGIKVMFTDGRILRNYLLVFLIGSYFSWNTGLLLVIGGILVRCTCVYLAYNIYAW